MKVRFLLSKVNMLIASLLALLGFSACRHNTSAEGKYGPPLEDYSVPSRVIPSDEPVDINVENTDNNK